MSGSDAVPEAPALVVRELGAGYPWAPRTIDQLNFTMQSGDCVALVGPDKRDRKSVV